MSVPPGHHDDDLTKSVGDTAPLEVSVSTGLIAALFMVLMAALFGIHGVFAAFSATAGNGGAFGWPVILGGVMIVGMPVFVLALITLAALVAIIRLPRFMRIAGRILRAMGLLLLLAGLEWYFGILDELVFVAIGAAGGALGWFGGGFMIRRANLVGG